MNLLRIGGTHVIPQYPSLHTYLSELVLDLWLSLIHPPLNSSCSELRGSKQEWWGVTPNITELAAKISEAGYRCLVPDLYKGKIGVDAEEAHHVRRSCAFDHGVPSRTAPFPRLMPIPSQLRPPLRSPILADGGPGLQGGGRRAQPGGRLLEVDGQQQGRLHR